LRCGCGNCKWKRTRRLIDWVKKALGWPNSATPKRAKKWTLFFFHTGQGGAYAFAWNTRNPPQVMKVSTKDLVHEPEGSGNCGYL
jgi:hypothetical protein